MGGGGTWHAFLKIAYVDCVEFWKEDHRKYDTASEPVLSLYSNHVCMEGLSFGVHFHLLQFVLCVQLARSAA